MEFFDWMSVPQVVLMFLQNSQTNSIEAAVKQSYMVTIISLIVAAGLYLVGLVFGGIGLMTMAKKQGLKNWWFGFLPFGNTYLTGKLAGDGSVFGKRIKRTWLWAILAEIAYVVLNAGLIAINMMMLNPGFYDVEAREVYGQTVNYVVFSSTKFLEIHPELDWLLTMQTVLDIVVPVVRFVALFFFCVLFFSFFRKYYARSPFLMTFLCALFPVRGFVLFAVRNNAPVDYEAFLRRRMEETMRRQGQYYGGRGGPMPGGFGQGPAGGSGADGGSGDPFSEFGGGSGSKPEDGGSNDDPFSDFN